MNFKISWSRFAENQLDEIYTYHKSVASLQIAKKLVKDIITQVDKLLLSPYLGQREPLLSNKEIPYHYLVIKNYKIIYAIDIKLNSIHIIDVFDTRQNPVKIIRNT
jgi:toxin ParE1/3/4